MMIRREEGFTLVELLVTMVIFVFVISSASVVFTGLLSQFKQQSKISETNVEGAIGLEILKQDVEQAGYGLPWNVLVQPDIQSDWASLASYNEVPSSGSPNPAWFNDGNPVSANPSPAVQRAPRAVLSGDNVGLNGSDYLVIKSVSVARNFAAGKWQYLHTGSGGNMKTWWAQMNEYVCRDDRGVEFPDTRVIVISPGATAANSRSLVVNAAGSYFSGVDNYTTLATFQPVASSTENRIIYGVEPSVNLRAPFNRADYYVKQPSSGMPARCAPGTGILYKAVMNHGTGSLDEIPIFDCVADMQVSFILDSDNDGDIDAFSDDISGLTAEQIRNQLREVRVYVVAHEGQRDMQYDFSQADTRIRLSATEVADTLSRSIDFADLKTQIGNPDFKYYRWRLYSLSIKPNNLR